MLDARLRPELSSPKRGLGGIARKMVSNRGRVGPKRKWRKHGYITQVEMLVNFLASPGHQKVCSLYISSLLTSRRVLVDECLWRQAQFCRYLHESKLHLESGRPLPKDLISDTEKWGNLSQEKSFSVSSKPSCSRTPEAASNNSIIPLNLFSVANQMWSACAFLCNIQDPILTSWHRREL